jgi:Protein of unknown function (DUF4239)
LFSWIYDIPSLLAIVLFGAGFVLIFWLGILILHPFIRKLLPPEPGLNATLTMYLQYFGIIYGLLLGLLAVGAYQNHAETRRAVVAEAASLAALYHDISEYPEPYRTDLRSLVREYTRFTIEDVWPKQRQGIMPELSGPNPVAGIYKRMAQFEPGTEGQDAIHQTALKQFNSFIEARRARLYRVSSGMPRVMWYTVALGALVNMIFLWLFEPQGEHPSLLGGLVSFFTATMIYLIAILDTLFRGEIGVSPEALQLVYQQMKDD